MQITAIPTLSQSLSLIKNLLGTTIGAITYLRNLFPEENFKDTCINGIALKSLARNYSQEADELMDWIENGIFDALEKKYLKTMIFGIFLDPSDPDKLIEGYTFGFSYPADDQWCITLDLNEKSTFNLKSKNEIMRATTEMLRKLLLLSQTLDALPENAYLNMKIFYYEDITPMDYQPPCFQEGDESHPFYFNQSPDVLNIGRVDAPHHCLTLAVQSVSPSMYINHKSNQKFNCDLQDTIHVINDLKNISIYTPPPSISRNLSKKCNDSFHSSVILEENNTQELIGQLLTGTAISKEPSFQLDSAPSVDLGNDTQPLSGNIPNLENAIYKQDIEFKNIDKEASAENVLSILQESGQRATRRRVSDILNPASLNDAQNDFHSQPRDPLYYSDNDVYLPDNSKISLKNNVQKRETKRLNCPCKISTELGSVIPNLEIVECTSCKKLCHAGCIGYLGKQVEKEYQCIECKYSEMSESDASEIAFLRLGVCVAWKFEGVVSRQWLKKILVCQLQVASILISQLQSKGFLSKGIKMKNASVERPNFPLIKNKKTIFLYNKYFNDDAESSNAHSSLNTDRSAYFSSNSKSRSRTVSSSSTISPTIISPKRLIEELDDNDQKKDFNVELTALKKRKISVAKKSIPVL